ncbi:serine palmitoyltransferase [Verticillium alfalfae VaMs.102]|uniref:serine C-palmitoyltransferase n=1 Tax=Verticillium alfalfae (strain VaMs.102 / ATCC MYA-4576 / FGSC 10136) TaxID=526221 RepID=C9SR97_VERA1|nr:serine palmitoyltransferase [Verticillium alfalfae VaMs.102]EEY21312.1 serine palmitoyltransferase [Verticillium alfalfae VaMs.102]
MDPDEIRTLVASWWRHAATSFQKVPGSAVLVRYVQSSYQNDPIRSALELVLVIFFIRYLLSPSYSTQKQNYVKLRDDEIDELVEDWTPEPLVGAQTAFEEMEAEKLPIIVGPTGPKSKLGNGRTVTNLATYNFYNFNANEQIKEKAIQTLRTYGVGPCGPPQFYGTQDVHMKTEADIAAYLGTESCIVYAQAFSTISSVIPAFCKRGDIIVADRAVNYSIRKGLEISRSSIKWYQHGDMDDLERVMQKVVKEQAGKRLTRRFIVAEGLFETTGDSIDLPKLVELKEKYKFRIILDETWSFGTLGRTGRGLTEAQNVDPTQVDMIIGSLAGPLCAGGGFCAGAKDVVEHQRISAASYTFSAALPAMLAVTASETVSVLQSNPDILTQCRDNIRAMRAQLDPRSDWVTCTSVPENPIMLLVLKGDVVEARNLSMVEQERLLQDCVDEHWDPVTTGGRVQPALKICVTSGLSKKDIEKAGVTIPTCHYKSYDPKGQHSKRVMEQHAVKHSVSGCVIPSWLWRHSLLSLLSACSAGNYRHRLLHAERRAEQLLTVVDTSVSSPTVVPKVVVYKGKDGSGQHTATRDVLFVPAETQVITLESADSTPNASSTLKTDVPAATDSSKTGSSSAASSLPGIAYAPYTASGDCKSANQVHDDFVTFTGKYSMVRIYGIDCEQVAKVVPAAKKAGLKLFLGIFELAGIDQQVASIVEAVGEEWSIVDTVSVGNELVNKKAATPSQVVSAMSQTRSLLRDAGYEGPVVTVDTFIAVRDNPELELLTGLRFLAAASRASPSSQSGPPFQTILATFFLFSAFNDPWKPVSADTFNAEQFWGIDGLDSSS